MKTAPLADFTALLAEVKQRIQEAQTRAVLAVNSELVRLYRDIGRIIDERQAHEGWGAAVIPRLARALHNELPEVKGFSERNIKRMLAFFREYPDPSVVTRDPVTRLAAPEKVPQPVAQNGSEKCHNPRHNCGNLFSGRCLGRKVEAMVSELHERLRSWMPPSPAT